MFIYKSPLCLKQIAASLIQINEVIYVSSSKTIIITSQALVLIATYKPVLPDDRMKIKFETFVVMVISLLSPFWCSFVKETVTCVSKSLLYCLFTRPH